MGTEVAGEEMREPGGGSRSTPSSPAEQAVATLEWLPTPDVTRHCSGATHDGLSCRAERERERERERDSE